ncbi:MAG: hypothetical protein R3261_02940, partial [Alphaproteobacteria bacterium]|nr:hypothetical protein [Alphaproteobacteria bacterium]
MQIHDKRSPVRLNVSKHARKLALATLFWGGLSAVAQAEETYFEWNGEVSAELRVFPDDAIQAGQEDQLVNSSLTLQFEALYEWNGGDDRIEFIPYARLDSHDEERSHADIREFNYLHVGDGWDIIAGIDKVYWGVIES